MKIEKSEVQELEKERQLTEELRQSGQRLTVAVEHSGLQYWEYDIVNSRAILSSKSRRDFRIGEIVENFPESWLNTGFIHPEDVEIYRNMMLKIKSGLPYAEWETRTLDLKTRAYRWMKIRYTTIFDEKNQPVRAVATAQDINAFRELERRFKQVLLQNGLWVWEYDMERREINKYNLANQQDPYGYRDKIIPNVPESIIERGTIYKDDIDTYLDLYRRIYQGEKRVSAKVRGWLSDKKEYSWQELTFTVVDGVDGKPVRAICSSRDISGEKQLEQRYLEENQYREEISSSMIATYRVNLTAGKLEEVMIHGTNVQFSSELEKTMDYRERASYFVSKNEISEEDNQKLAPDYLMKQYAQDKNFTSIEYNAKTKEEQNLIRIHVDCRVLKRPDTGELIAFFYESDVTKEYCMNHIMSSIIEQEYDVVGLIFASSNFVYLYAHKRDTAIPSVNNNHFDSICEKFLREYGYAEDMEELVQSMQLKCILEKLETESTYMIEFSILELDGTIRRKEIRFSYIDRKEGLISISRRDIEDIAQAEKRKQEQLERALNIAEQASSAKGEFLARMSHEIRTPMNAIIGLLSLAEQEAENTGAVRDYLEKIKNSSRHLLNLINDVLDMSKIESGELCLHSDLCKFSEFAQEVSGVIRPLCEQRNIRYIEEGELSDTKIVADKLRFNQVLLNLLSNAVKFTPEGGTIHFQYKNSIADRKLIADFEIKDNGIGISREFQKCMFDSFTQESRENQGGTQGTGLGLAISKAIIDKMNGSIEVKSSPGMGTCFWIHIIFPLAEENGEQETDQEQDRVRISLLGKRILLAEDHPMNQMIAKRILENNGMHVETAKNGLECVKLFKKRPAWYFDAVLMDIRMPVMDGITAAKTIRSVKREDAAEIPVIAMTANAFDEDVRATKDAGMNAHLAKPMEPALMLRTLEAWMEKRTEKNRI